MAAASASLFDNPFLSDVTIRQICGDKTKEYRAHKAVLCAHSDYFMRMFNGNFKEASEAVVTLRDDDPIHFEVMLKYIYTLEMKEPSTNEETDPIFHSKFLLPVGVFALADKYGVHGLKKITAIAFPTPQSSMRLSTAEVPRLIEAHYATCVDGDCLMGQAIAQQLLVVHRAWILSDAFLGLVKKFPNLAADVLLVAPIRNYGRLWQ